MKAVRLQSYGDVDQFKLEDVPTPSPGAGEVLIKVEASAVNHIDLFLRQGYLAQMMPLELPAILGADGAGTIAAVGPGVSGFGVGDRVIARFAPNGKGSHAEYAVAPVAGIAKLPANLSFEVGATLALVGLTGRQAVDALAVQPGERVLVAGALSAVGRASVQYLKELGARPVAGVLPHELDEGRTIAGEAIDITQAPAGPSFERAVAAVQGAAANAVKHVRDGGKVASSVQAPEGANQNVKFEMIMSHDDPVVLQKVADAAGRGELVIPIAETFALNQVGAAHGALATGPRGKIVVRH
jgi:NADPH:quinone reductase-like Zn-dependent oxidoreductase